MVGRCREPPLAGGRLAARVTQDHVSLPRTNRATRDVNRRGRETTCARREIGGENRCFIRSGKGWATFEVPDAGFPLDGLVLHNYDV